MSNPFGRNSILFSKVISFFIAFILVFSPTIFPVYRAQAQLEAAVGGILACTGLSTALSTLSSSVISGLNKVPVIDFNVGKNTGDILNKECSLDAIASATAKLLYEQITQSTLNWINSGFDGEPAFISDPDQFFYTLAKKEADDFIYSTDIQNIYEPYRGDIRKVLERHFLSKTGGRSFKDRSRCDLDKYVKDGEAFRSGKFSEGGWDAWLEATQNSNCNEVGVQLTAQNELDRRITLTVNEEELIANWNSGFKSFKDQFGKITTPGIVISEQLNKILGQGFDQLTEADEINEIITAAIRQLTKKAFSRNGLLN